MKMDPITRARKTATQRLIGDQTWCDACRNGERAKVVRRDLLKDLNWRKNMQEADPRALDPASWSLSSWNSRISATRALIDKNLI